MPTAPGPATQETSGATESLWHATAEHQPHHAPLDADASVDVCVVGAGIAGLSTAYQLARVGRTVLVLDDGPIGSGETGRTTAHLSPALDDRYTVIEQLFGAVGARAAAESHMAAVDEIERVVREEGVDCDFERLDGYLVLAGERDVAFLEREREAATRAGLPSVRLVERTPVDAWPGAPPALRFPRQGRFHPLRYLAGLARAAERAGARIHAGTPVTAVEGGAPCTVRTAAGHAVTARDVVVATNSPVNDLVAMHTKQAPYRTYVVALRVPKGSVSDALYWDTLDPYHYVRLQRAATHDVLIAGGEDHKTGQADDGAERLARLEAWTRERFPQAGEVAYRWSGQVMEPVDAMAFIGPDAAGAEHVYIATGDSGNGMTHGTIAGLLLCDLIAGRPNPWATLYDPSRKPTAPRSLEEYARENANVAVQYTDWVRPGEVADAARIAPGSGAVLRRGAHLVAAWRDAAGVLHERSAVCTHLRCIVQWNAVEGSWDCPCHGSRFSADGREVLNGPALAPLGEAGGGK